MGPGMRRGLFHGAVLAALPWRCNILVTKARHHGGRPILWM